MTMTDQPTRIGRFQIESMLGRGAMGVVYKGHDKHIDRPVAIKLIRADLLDGEERESYFRRFQNEAKIAGRCVHANIVGLYDFSFYEGNPYLVMEYVNGIGLQQALPRGSQRSEGEVLPIALQMLDALQYAHERGIVHRDIKPANILISPDTKLKITDFGISRLLSMELTMTPLLIGTPSYMSPEQCMGASLDGRSDLFSLGCVLYELLAGHRPFQGANYTDTILGIISRPHTPLQEIRDDLPPGLVAAIDKALAKKPEDRFPNADAFGRALEKVLGGSFRAPALPPIFAEMVAMSQSRDAAENSTRARKKVPPPAVIPATATGDDEDTVVVSRSSGPIKSPEIIETHLDYSPSIDSTEPDNTVVYPAPSFPERSDQVQMPTADDQVVRSPLLGSEDDVKEAEVPFSRILKEESNSADLQTSEACGEAGETEKFDHPDLLPATAKEMSRVEPAASDEISSPEANTSTIEHAEAPGSAEHGYDFPVSTTFPEERFLTDLAAESEGEETVSGSRDWEAWQNWTTACLVRVIGPIGPLVVTRFRDNSHPENFVEQCSLFIRNVEERAVFLRLVAEGPKMRESARS